MSEGNWENRAAATRLALEIDPQSVEHRRELIRAYRALGQHEELIAQQMRLAELYLDRELLDLAEAEYRAITQQYPHYEPAWQAVFDLVQRLGKEKEIVNDYLAYSSA